MTPLATVHPTVRAIVALLGLLLLLTPAVSAAPPHSAAPPQSAAPDAPAATLTVGSGCTFSTLQAAVNAAASGDQIRMQTATFNGQTVITNKSLTISGGWNTGCTVQTVGARTTLNGNNSGSVLEISGNVSVLLTEMGITGGTNDADFGGGIQITNATVTLANTLVYGNNSDYGGGVYLSGGHLLLSNFAQIYTNSANQNGGGIYASGAGTLTLQPNTTIGSTLDGFGNSALNGGGIFVANAGLTTRLVTLNGNAALRYNRATGATGLGGGIYMQGGTLNATGATGVIANNSAYNGGGVLANNGAQVTLGLSVYYNSASNNGGGVFASGASTQLTLNGSATIGDNLASMSGGGVYVSQGTFTATGDALIGHEFGGAANEATVSGGGVYCVSATCSFSGNASVSANTTPGVGGGIYAYASSVTLGDSARVRANTAEDGGGGIYATNATTLVAEQTAQIGGVNSLDGNFAYSCCVGDGGGIFATGNGTNVTLRDAVLVGDNYAPNGGGVALFDRATLTVSDDVLFQQNVGDGLGGAIRADFATVRLSGNVVLSNNDAFHGGAIHGLDAVIDLEAAVVIGGATAADGNTARGSGAGIYLDFSILLLDGTTLRHNRADDDGGAVLIENDSTISALNTTFADNSADRGGALFNQSQDITILSNVRFLRNSARLGGAIYTAGRLNITAIGGAGGCTPTGLAADTYCNELTANSASEGGAAIYALGTGGAADLHLRDIAVQGNQNGLAAIYLLGTNSAFSIYNSLLVENNVPAIRSNNPIAHDWRHLTFAANTAHPFILSGSGTLAVTNSIAWGNTNNGSLGIYAVSGGCNRSAGSVLPGSDHSDPFFQTQPRGKYRLAGYSPAVDACASGLPFDLDGRARPIVLGGVQLYDQGAFERQAFPTAVTLSAQAAGAAGDLTNLALALLLGVMTLAGWRRRFGEG